MLWFLLRNLERILAVEDDISNIGMLQPHHSDLFTRIESPISILNVHIILEFSEAFYK